MPLAVHVADLLERLGRQEVEEMPPVERQRFADLCRHWADVADRPANTRPPAGVLFDLSTGARPE
jgi:hypothetical protein